MNTNFKNILAIVLIISAAAVTACGKKGGGASGGEAAAAPPPAPANPATDDSIPAATNETVAIYPGSWKGQLAVTNEGAYRQFVTESGLCKKTSCLTSAGFLKLEFKIKKASLPRKLVSKSYLTTSYKKNDIVKDGYSLDLKNIAAVSNADKNGFQFSDCVFGGQSSDETGMLRVVAFYADNTRTNINVKVLYSGVKIAEGPMGFFPLYSNDFPDYQIPQPTPWDDWIQYDYYDESDDDNGHNHNHNHNGGWNWHGNNGNDNSFTIGGSNQYGSGFFKFSWN